MKWLLRHMKDVLDVLVFALLAQSLALVFESARWASFVGIEFDDLSLFVKMLRSLSAVNMVVERIAHLLAWAFICLSLTCGYFIVRVACGYVSRRKAHNFG